MIKHSPGSPDVVIVTDSLGMPRRDTPFDSVWVGSLIRDFPNLSVVPISRRAMTIEVAESVIKDVALTYNPRALVIQVGVVDATRRARPLWLVSMVKSLPVVRPVIHTLARRYHYRLSKTWEVRHTSLRSFRKALRSIKCSVKCPTLWISIAPPATAFRRQVYGISEDIERYNRMIKYQAANALIDYVDPYSIYPPDEVCRPDDGHHLSHKGHDIVLDAVKKWLKRKLCEA